MVDVQAIGFSISTITNWLAILAILLSGYLLYLIYGRRERRNRVERNPTEIERFMNILAFGMVVITFVAGVTGILSVNNGHEVVTDNIYLQTGLYLTIFFSSIGIVLKKIEIRVDRRAILFWILVIIVFCFFISECSPIKTIKEFIENYSKCHPQLLIQNESNLSDEACNTFCYDKYQIFNISNVTNGTCYCDIRNC